MWLIRFGSRAAFSRKFSLLLDFMPSGSLAPHPNK
jgi:hypothetical protein